MAERVLQDQKNYDEPADYRSRWVGVFFVLIELACLIAYGISGGYYVESNPSGVAYTQIVPIILLFLFTLAGFGLLQSIFRFGSWLGMATAIVIMAISIQLSPLLQKFWFDAFITGFNRRGPVVSSVGANIQQFYSHYYEKSVDASYIQLRTTHMSTISLLVVNTAVLGRVGIKQIMKMAVIHQFMWNLNYMLLVWFCVLDRDFNDTANYSPLFFDYFGSSYVYVFASFYGLIFSYMLRGQKLPYDHPRNQYNRASLVLSHIGTGFIFATFFFSSNLFISFNNYGRNLAAMAIFFSLTGSVIGAYVGSALFGKGKVGYKQCLTGTITGGVVIASVAPIIDNIGIIIMIGSIAGFFSGIYMRTLHLKVNKKFIFDQLGLFGPFMIASVLGSFVVTPSLLAYYHNHGITYPSIGLKIPTNFMGWQLVYFGISAALGIGAGLLTGSFCVFDKDYYGVASNSRIFEDQFGLFTPKSGVVYAPESNYQNNTPHNKNETSKPKVDHHDSSHHLADKAIV